MKIKKKAIKIAAIVLAIILVVATIVAIVIANDFDRAVRAASKNLTEYSIEANYDENVHTISAKEQVSYLNKTGESLDKICFHLYPQAFREGARIVPYTALTEARCFPNGKNYGSFQITSLIVAGEPKSLTISGEDSDILEVNLPSHLEKNKRIEICINFLLTLPNCTHRLGWFENNVNLGNWYPIACEYEGDGVWDTTPYYATGDPFNSSVANYNVKISAPSGFNIIASGERVSDITKNSMSTATFEGRAIRDFAAVLSTNTTKHTDQVNNTTINYYAAPDDNAASAHLKLACEALFTFNDLFGDYPYHTLNVVTTPFMQGGMEYPNLVMASSLVTGEEEFRKVIIHEIAHQWWYGVVGNDEVNEAWFDEGLSEYSTFLFYEKNPQYGLNLETLIEDAVAGYNLYLEVFNAININVNREMNLPVNNYASEYEYTYMVYVKGAIMFNEISKTIGENAFLNGLKKVYKQYKFSKINAENLAKAFKSSNKVQAILNRYITGQSVYDL